MKKLILSFALLFTISLAKSQNTKNGEDLAFLYQTIQKLPSYKDQVKNNPKLKFDLAKDFTFSENAAPFEVFSTLYKLILPIRDNHLSFYSHRDSLFAKPSILEIPKAKVDSARAKKSPSDNVEGTYYAGKYKMELIKIDDDYIGVIENNNRYYTQFILKEMAPNHFDVINFNKNGQGYFVLRNIVYINQRLSGLPWRKYETPDFVSVPANAPKFEYKKLEDDISYLKLGSFATTNTNIDESIKFYDQLGEISAKHLIVDLRNNGGGGFKTSKKFIDLIKIFKGQIHLLVNNHTVSNAEQFVVDLMNRDNTFIYGEDTRGTISYGSNTDTVIDLPSKRFSFYITDMKARKQDIPFESVGIKPQIYLNPFTNDWIAQVLEKIKSKS